MKTLILLSLTLFVAGCDTGYGVFRYGPATTVPDMGSVAKKIKTYPEVKKVQYTHWIDTSRPLTLHGLEKGDALYRIRYEDGENVCGTLDFSKDHNGHVTYRQYLFLLNRRPPQRQIDSTWTVMKKVEYDLVHNFDLKDLSKNATTKLHGVEDPNRPNNSLLPTGNNPTNSNPSQPCRPAAE